MDGKPIHNHVDIFLSSQLFRNDKILSEAVSCNTFSSTDMVPYLVGN